ncbi:DMT family transporter [Myroides albus]|uniref:EamA family transporter n=1 Tax=Myroides albus TaxID=2562892 RepID=A0A6I3LND5_9FLAO|nr:DMT family transporter [Myroides albus]MTG98996.1 EamA family transporter [Myroides albus]UVD78252.1 DMT family transporter [Myroides albus]
MFSKPRIALFIGILCISIFPVIVKMNLTPSLISAFYRMAIAALFVVPYAFITKKLHIYPRRTMFYIVLCGIFFGSDIAVWNQAIQGSTATQATLLTNLAPVWVGIGSYFFLTNKPSINFWIGTVFALIGMVVLVGVDVFVNLSFDLPFGLGILSGVLYACYILLSKKVLGEVGVIPFMTYSLLVSSLFLGIVNWISGSSFIGFSTAGWLSLVVQGIVCQLLAWLLISYATQNMRATRVSLSLLSQALIAALLAWMFLDEDISSKMIYGGVIILFGIAITFIEKPLWSFRKRVIK